MKNIKPKIETKLLTLNEATKKFGIPRSTLNYYIKMGYIKLYDIPSTIRAINVDELKQLRQKQANKYKIEYENNK